MKPATDNTTDGPDGPAVITQLHVQDRPATDDHKKEIIGKAAWRKLTVFQKYSMQANEPLSGGSPKYNGWMRLQAGVRYAKLYDEAECPGRDSTQALNAVRSSGGGGSPSDARSKASSELACIHSHMGQRDREIIILVCGRGFWPSEAVREVCGTDYRHSVPARLRESLDALIEALETARRQPGRVNLGRVA